MTGPKPQASTLALIQVQLILGPLGFAGVTWWLHARRGLPATSLPDGIQYALPVLCVLALSGLMFVRRMRAPITDVGQFTKLSVIGWTIGDFAAITGTVYYFATNDPTWAISGILVMLIGAVMLPATIPPQ